MFAISRRNLLSAGAAAGVATVLPLAVPAKVEAVQDADDRVTVLLHDYLAARLEYDEAFGLQREHVRLYSVGRSPEFHRKQQRASDAFNRVRGLEKALGIGSLA